MSTDDEPRSGTARSALRHRAFRRVFAGMFASNIGTWMQSMVVSALAYDLTRDPWFVGMISFASFLPALFLSIVGGAIADRYDRRRVIELLSWQ